MLSLINVLLLHRRMLAVAAAMGFVTLVALSAFGKRTFASVATFMPQARTVQSNVAGLAAQFGINVGTGEPGQTPQFYMDLIESRQILREVAESRFTARTDTGTVTTTLVDLYGPANASPAVRQEAAIGALGGHVRARAKTTGVIELAVSAGDPSLAQQIANRILVRINQFNLERRQSQAAAERKFAENRLTEVRAELQRAEDALQSFLQRNRQYDNAPALAFERDRLAREVSMRQQVYTSLAQSYEQAKLDEVRDTPVITVIEPPEVPLRPEPRGLAKKGVIGLLLGLMVGVLLAFFRQVLASTSGDASGEQSEFSALKRAAVDDLKHPWRLFFPRGIVG